MYIASMYRNIQRYDKLNWFRISLRLFEVMVCSLICFKTSRNHLIIFHLTQVRKNLITRKHMGPQHGQILFIAITYPVAMQFFKVFSSYLHIATMYNNIKRNDKLNQFRISLRLFEVIVWSLSCSKISRNNLIILDLSDVLQNNISTQTNEKCI